jgi:acetate---CoA ligase (ADP-forming)
VVDPLASRGITIEPPSAATRTRLAAAGIEVRPARLIDLTIAGARYDTMKVALDIVLAAPEFDLVLAVVGSSARAQAHETVRPIIDSAGGQKPLAAFLVPDAPDALAALARAGVPSFRTPEACADAIAAALSRQPPRPVVMRIEAHGADGGRRMLDELAAGRLLDQLGIPRAPSIALDADISAAPDLPFAYPVAVKVLSGEIAHKSDVGGVMLDIGDGEALLAAMQKVRADVTERMPGVPVASILVQSMQRGLGEALVGYRVDRDVGPLVMVAAGGVLTEIERDRSLRLAPVELAAARAMLAEVRGLVALSGYRGRRKGDLDALAATIVALSQLAHDPAIAEAEINPLIVLPDGEGVVAVDALVKLARNA